MKYYGNHSILILRSEVNSRLRSLPSFIHHPFLSSFLTIVPPHHLYALSMDWIILYQSFIWRLEQSFCQASTIKLVLWLILMAYFCYLASALTNINDILKDKYSVTSLLSSHCWLTWWHIKGEYPSDLCHQNSFPEYLMAYWKWTFAIKPVTLVNLMTY